MFLCFRWLKKHFNYWTFQFQYICTKCFFLCVCVYVISIEMQISIHFNCFFLHFFCCIHFFFLLVSFNVSLLVDLIMLSFPPKTKKMFQQADKKTTCKYTREREKICHKIWTFFAWTNLIKMSQIFSRWYFSNYFSRGKTCVAMFCL
jgi:hypothetical protein